MKTPKDTIRTGKTHRKTADKVAVEPATLLKRYTELKRLREQVRRAEDKRRTR